MSAFFDNFMFSYQAVIFAVGINGLLALSMYAVLAVGQLSLGQAAFMGIGAYVSALLTINLDWPFPAVLLAAMVVPALLALLIGGPTLRLTGVYLALATIAIVEILRIFLNASSYTGGALGLSGIPNKTTVVMRVMLLKKIPSV